MKRLLILIGLILSVTCGISQATKSYPFAVGRTLCSSGTQQIHYYNYNGVTNTIQNATGGLVNPCVPQLRIGGAANGTQRFTSNLASVSFNPKDHNIYYFWTSFTGGAKTYAWRWPVGTCPGTTANKLDTIKMFNADILGVAFDPSGNGFLIEFTQEPNGVPHKGLIRSINFATGVIGVADTMNLSGGATIYQTGSGDVAISPSGQMFFVVDNKLFTPNYSAYTGTGASLTCTYIDTVKTTNNFVGLTYAEGEAVAAYSGGGCPFEEIKLLTAVNSPIAKNNTPTNVYSTADFATIITGLGASKSLVSVTPTGTANQYDVVYDIKVKNYGNMDVTNLQVTDSLNQINGAINVSNVIVTIPVNPNGYTVNSTYTGIGSLAANYNLLSGTPTLPNYPVANSSFTIRISCRLSNIQSGTVYYNHAIASGRDFNSNNLYDISTNGSNPDLNSNDKPDDTGEDQPTPLLVSVTAQTPPCTVLSKVLFSQDFGSGTGLTTSFASPVLVSGATLTANQSFYTGSTTAPIPTESFTISNNANNANTSQFINQTDRTGNANGRMLIVNADAANTRMYRGGFDYTLCPSQQYSVSFYAAFIGNASYQTLCNGFGGFKYPRIRIRVIDGSTGLIITEASTADIISTSWNQYGLKFASPGTYTSIIFELINDAEGGCGNDIAIDEVKFGSCDPDPMVNVNSVAGCIGGSTTFTGSLNDPNAIPGAKQYQWQVATVLAGPFTDIAGATSSTYTINPLTAGDVGKYYRLGVAASGNIGNANCRFYSGAMLLTGKNPSVAATSANKDKNNICPGKSVNLSITGGSLGTNAVWRWYAGSCSGTAIGTGFTLAVTPSVTTTYYVRAEGDCNTTACVAVTVFISCDLDKDKDGIPDYIESYMPAAWGDHNGNTIINAFDAAYPGFKDNNNDFVNDDFQADGDSDNDGIPNYLDTDFPGRVDTNGDGVDDRFDMDKDGKINMLDLDSDNDGIPDVVEAGGVDANGDGKIDNYTDTDGDGISQNVDANNTGAYNSGLGLGYSDLDGDGKANAIDRDSDGDGMPDVVEVFGPDTNNDAIIDGSADTNGDGLHDGYINGTALLITGPDANNDGHADNYPNKNMDYDKRANPYDTDSDGDGIVDVIEAGFPDTDYNGFVDGPVSADGWNTALHSLGSLSLLNSDNNGKPNYLDIDSDDDGIPDNIEGQTTAGYKLPTYLDNDGDGLDNAYDLAPYNNAFGGSGIYIVDKDGDTIPDYIDLDTDADGVPDIIEGNDFNLNGFSDDNVSLTNLDDDGDGLDNRFDSLNSVTNIKGTSYMMGTGGSTVGDPSPGTRSPVQKTNPSQPERDWRYVSFVLPLNLLDFSATLSSNAVVLNWDINSPVFLDHFEIERSNDNSNFELLKSINAEIPINELRNFAVQDDIRNAKGVVFFYRLKVIAKNGRFKYSDVIAVRRIREQQHISLFPNPAKDVSTIDIYAATQEKAIISLKDYTGKEVLNFTYNVSKGKNNIMLSGLEKFSNGLYTVQIFLNDEVKILKLAVYH